MELEQGPSALPLEAMVRSFPGEAWLVIGADGSVLHSITPGEGILGQHLHPGTHIAQLLHPGDLPRALNGMQALRETPGVPSAGPVRARHADGTWKLLEVHAVNRIDDPAIGGVVVRVKELGDLDEPTSAESDLVAEDDHDALTGVASRDAFARRLASALDEAEGTGRPVTLVVIDLDAFGSVNERHGRTAGDKVLQVVAARLRAAVRPGDFVGRLHGDEFGVVCPGLPEDVAPIAAGRFVDAIRVTVDLGATSVALNATAATATTPPLERRAQALVEECEAAMPRNAEIETWAPGLDLSSYDTVKPVRDLA